MACTGKPSESGMTTQGVRLKKQQELRPEGTYVILKNLALVAIHAAMFTGQLEMKCVGDGMIH